jgi:perosamine synthetase
MEHIPVSQPDLSGNEAKYLQECLSSGWISSEGPFVSRLEQDLAKHLGRHYGIAVSSGTAALEIAIRALGIGPGDQVIMPAFTIISCAAAIVRAGALPVVVDSEPDTWNMNVSRLEAAISPQTKAIMVVHIYGLPVDMDPVISIAKKHNLKIIEDAAEALGQTYRGVSCGRFGDISILSFYPNKVVATGEGGMLLTDDPSLKEHCCSLRNLCFQPLRRFVHEELGYNFRMSNVQAALGVAQVERLSDTVKRKREIGLRYNRLFADCSEFTIPVAATAYADNAYWVYGLVLRGELPFNALDVMQKLAERGIETRPFFWPMNKQPVFLKQGLFHDVHCPVAEFIGERGFYLPSGSNLSAEQLERIAHEVITVVRG